MAAALALGAWPALGAAPALTGLFRANELGLLELKAEGPRVFGDYVAGGVCGFEVNRRVLEGQLEGNVFVGKVLLCQTGPACAERSYSFLGVYSPERNAVMADVKVDAACEAPGLGKRSRLALTAATAEDRAVLGKGPNALAAAKRRANPRKVAELSTQALLKGRELLNLGDYAGAAQQFQVGISYDPDNWIGHMGLGVAEFKRNNVLKAVDAYERARELVKDSRDAAPQVYVNLACAHSRLGDRRAALANLRQGVKLGFDDPDHLTADPDLNKLFQGDPEFKRLVNAAGEARDKGKGRGGKP